MPKEQRCPKCGAELAAFATEGFCSACLLERGLSFAPSAGALSLSRFGDYELIEEIARGGMGVVYKARQVSLDRIVAVKMILSGQFASATEIQRFRAEARAAASLQHPNIVAIHEVGEHEGLLYFSMDFVEGRNLAQLIRDGPCSAARAAQCMGDIAEAIHYAHEHGVLHRDLKPSNVLIDAAGKSHVTDFGLAKRMVGMRSTASHSISEVEREELTLTGQVLGSPNFMPPEQAAGRHRELTPAADVYSLGALLYHLLTGRPPFLADNIPATLRLVSETEPVSPRLLAPNVPRDLETICLKCLEKDPQRRYATAKELVDELARFLRDEPIRARPVAPVEKLWRWRRRNPLLAGTLSLVMLLLLIVAIGSPIAAIRINRALQEAEAGQAKARLEATKSQQAAQFLKETLRAAGPSAARRRDTTLLREILESTVKRVESELKDQPEVRGDVSVVLGTTYKDIGDYPAAIKSFDLAVASYRLSFGKEHAKLALALGYLGASQCHNRDLSTGKTNAQLGLQMARKCGDPETLATCLENMAAILFERGKWADAETMLRETFQAYQKIRDQNQPDQRVVLRHLAESLLLQGKGNEADSLLREQGERFPTNVYYLELLGQLRAYQNDWAAAIQPLSRAYELDPSFETFFYFIALLHSGHFEEYQRLRTESLKKIGGKGKLIDDEATVFLLLGGDQAEMEQACRFAENTIRRKLGRTTNNLLEGLLKFRRGDFASAKASARRQVADVWPPRQVAGLFLLALADAELHQINFARAALSKGEEALDGHGPGGFLLDEPEWQLALWLGREARKLIEQSSAGLSSAESETAEKAADPAELRDYLEARASALSRQGQWKEAVLELTKVIELQPTNYLFYLRRGEILGRTGHWKEAAADLAKALELQPEQQQPWFELAALLVQAGDLEAYREDREAMLTRFQGTSDPPVARAIVRACLLLPASDEQLPVIGRLADSALVQEHSWMELAKGTAEYRQGRFASVVDWMKKALVRPPNDWRDATAWMVLAMAHHQLKQPDEARAAFAKGKELIETKLPMLDSGDLGLTWGDVLVAHILMREAQNADPSDDPSKTAASLKAEQ